jgi:peptidoglycan/LPS O-acetylase OafA/YrhL
MDEARRRHAVHGIGRAPIYRPEIDGLRAIAVLAVVAYHAWPALLPGGFVGVDVFFVISGYLITALLAAEWEAERRIDLPAFYARRVRRLWPALVVVVLAVVAAGVLLVGRDGPAYRGLLDSAAASLLFLGNFYFQAHSGGYFDAPAGAMPLLHLWSLAVEEQYYLVYPLLLPLLLRAGRRRAGWLLAALSLLSLLLAEAWMRSAPERAFFQMPARFWELALGGWVALSAADAAAPRVRWPLAAGLALVGAACVATSWSAHFPGLGALPAVAGAALVLLSVHRGPPSGMLSAALRSPPMVGIGLLSYSLYLWHWPLLSFDEALRMEPANAGWRALLCVVALALAWTSWRFVETPLRRAGTGVRPTLLRGAAATVLTLAAVMVLGRLELTPPEARALAAHARADRPAALAGCHFGMDARVVALKPAACRSASAGPTRLLLWGDSHALAWQPFAWAMARQQDVVAESITMDACPPFAGVDPPPSAAHPRHAASCARLSTLALERLAAGRIDTLVLAMRWPLPLAGSAAAAPAELAQRLLGLDRLAARARTTRIWLIGPVPGLKRDAPGCIATGRERQCAWTRAQVDAAVAPVWAGLKALAAKHPNITLIDPRPYLCDDARCPVQRDGRALYWDDDHVAASAAADFHAHFRDDPAQYTVPAAADPAETPERP